MPDKLKNNPSETAAATEQATPEKNKPLKPPRVKKPVNWQILAIYIFLTGALILTTAIAVYKHRRAITALNKANEIMMTNTGIIIDSVNIKSFQEAEYILNEKQKTATRPDQIRNMFLYDQMVSIKKNNAIMETNGAGTDTETATGSPAGTE